MSIPSPADGSATSKCIECGADISLKAKFCADCGALQVASRTGLSEHVEEDAAVDSPTTSNSAEERSPTEAATSENASHVCEHPSRKQLIAASLVVGCLAICSALYFGFRMSPKEQFDRGFKYETGQSVKQDDAQAASWYQKAADRGYAEAQEKLGEMYESGTGGLPKDDAQAVSWYRKAAEQGNAEAQSNLALMYYDGKGVAKDEAEAVHWWRKAAEQGNAESQDNLGVMYEDGEGGLSKDDGQAVFWIQKAAEQGNAHAKVNLANIRVQQQQGQSSNSEPSANRNPRAMICNTVGWSGGMKPAELTDGRSLEVKIVPIRGSANQLVASLIAVGPVRVENYEPVMPKEVIWKANLVNEKPDWPSGSWIAKSGTTELGSMNFVYEDESTYRLTVTPPNAMPETLLGKCYDDNEK